MATDRHEAAKRGQQRKPATKHPYAAIEHRVIDSPAYADLSFSARALLIQFARQLTAPNNNGRLLAAHSYLGRYQFAENTLTRGISELIDHGFLFRTRTGGFHQGSALFAVTWVALTDYRDGLSCNGFKPFAWREWTPVQKKTRPPNLRTYSRKNGGLTKATAANLEAAPPPKFEDSVLMPVHKGYGLSRPSLQARGTVPSGLPVALPDGTGAPRQIRKIRPRHPLSSTHCIRLAVSNDRGALRLTA